MEEYEENSKYDGGEKERVSEHIILDVYIHTQTHIHIFKAHKPRLKLFNV